MTGVQTCALPISISKLSLLLYLTTTVFEGAEETRTSRRFVTLLGGVISYLCESRFSFANVKLDLIVDFFLALFMSFEGAKETRRLRRFVLYFPRRVRGVE